MGKSKVHMPKSLEKNVMQLYIQQQRLLVLLVQFQYHCLMPCQLQLRKLQ